MQGATTAVNPYWKGSLLLLGALLAGALVDSLFAFGEGAQPIRPWLLYLAAHAFCYAFILSSRDGLAPWGRILRAASFAGAMMIGVAVVNVAIGFMFASSMWMKALAVWPATILAMVVLAVAGSIGVGLGYGLCIVVGQKIWFSHRAPKIWPAAIWHVLWGMTASFVAVSAIFWTRVSLAFDSASATGGYLAAAGLMWLMSMPHLFLAWRASLAGADGAQEMPAEPPRPAFLAGSVAALALPLLFAWSLGLGQLALGGSVEEIRLGDQTYHVPSRLIITKHLDNLPALDRRWIYLRMELSGPGLEATTFNVHVVEQPTSGRGSLESLDCKRDLFGTMSGCWRRDSMDWKDAYPFPKPTPDSSLEVNSHRVVSRIDIVVVDARRQYQTVLSGLTGGIELDDGRASWELLVPDRMLKDLDKIIVAARVFQEQLKQAPQMRSD